MQQKQADKQPESKGKCLEDRQPEGFPDFKNLVEYACKHLWSREIVQYWLARPDLAVHGFRLGFDTMLAKDNDGARIVIEKFISSMNVDYLELDAGLVKRAKQLLIWILRQSRGLTEEIVLYSPHDPLDQTPQVLELAKAACLILEFMESSCRAESVDLHIVMRGVGCPLSFHCGSMGNVFRFYLTYKTREYDKARRVFYWEETVKLRTPDPGSAEVPPLPILEVPPPILPPVKVPTCQRCGVEGALMNGTYWRCPNCGEQLSQATIIGPG